MTDVHTVQGTAVIITDTSTSLKYSVWSVSHSLDPPVLSTVAISLAASSGSVQIQRLIAARSPRQSRVLT